MKQFRVVNKSEGYSIKNFTTEQKAREFATKCNKNNSCNDFTVCIYEAGTLVEI